MIPLRCILVAAAVAIPAASIAATPSAVQRILDAATGARSMPSRTFESAPPAAISWRAPSLAPDDLVSMPALNVEKSALVQPAQWGHPLQIGTNRSLDKDVPIDDWRAAPAGGYVAKVRVTSEGALGLRLRLDLGTVPGAFELVAQGSGSPRLESMPVDPTLGNTHWTPWTDGASQVIELFSPVRPSPGAVSVGLVSHFFDSPIEAKQGAGSCTVSAQCSTGDTALDAAIAQRTKSNVKISFVNSSGAFLCTATLINSPLAPAPFLVTANHCITTANEAASITTYWFYEATSCTDPSTAPGLLQVGGGTQLVFTNYNVDSTLVRMNQAAPAGAVFSGWSAAHVADGTSIVSVSHPEGDTSRVALGSVSTEFRVSDWPYDMYAITFTSGIIQPGSSGSGLFTLNSSGSLDLRGVLTGSTTDNSSDGLSCTDLNEYGLYDRFEVFEPEIDQYISGNIRTDDAPNRIQDFTGTDTSTPLDQRGSALVYPNMKIDYPGDIDIWRFTLAGAATVHVFSSGGLDTVGTLMDSQGNEIAANDDESSAGVDFGITKALQPGTYFVAVGDWDPQGTGTYTMNLATQAASASVNYTDLWWNSPAGSESGWGLNINHQGNILFATLFTYDITGAPLWLVMSDGAKQSDGSFAGTLYHTSGAPFNANPWNPGLTQSTVVGSMTLAFDSSSTGTLTYTYNGTTVTKHIVRESFSTPSTTCAATTADRSTATNYQDLWWNPNESGWGMNVTQQGSIAFATLFDYDSTGHATWWVMSDGEQTGAGTFTGQLYSTTGPVFNASPWSAIGVTNVGTMTLHFTSGTAGTLTYSVNGITVQKSIQRQTFSSPLPLCQ